MEGDSQALVWRPLFSAVGRCQRPRRALVVRIPRVVVVFVVFVVDLRPCLRTARATTFSTAVTVASTARPTVRPAASAAVAIADVPDLSFLVRLAINPPRRYGARRGPSARGVSLAEQGRVGVSVRIASDVAA
jgi:hypothetical protein